MKKTVVWWSGTGRDNKSGLENHGFIGEDDEQIIGRTTKRNDESGGRATQQSAFDGSRANEDVVASDSDDCTASTPVVTNASPDSPAVVSFLYFYLF